ncbi:MAG: RnfABCDGE type electron transport complex subunit D [Deltaproteobacteria bacterium]|nr:RnfABCDGE type electron transport complex subunit D [Deltaproteobacteria bacterium]
MRKTKYAGPFKLSSSPHIRSEESVPTIMCWVVGSLVPAMGGAVFFFGLDAIRILLISILTCLVTEYIFLAARKKDASAVFDGSALITGILFALVLPPGLKSSHVVIGAFVSIALGKQVFGGLGYNIFNPALVGRAFLQAAFPVAMTTWIPPLAQKGVDTLTFATPLARFKFSAADVPPAERLADLDNLFIGHVGGCLGETSALLLLVGAGILLVKRYIDWRIPTGILAAVFALTGIVHLINPEACAPPLFHIFAGGLLLGGFFMATDMVTSPITRKGTWIYGVSIGVLVVLIRIQGGLPEGVMYAILFMNAFVPILNRFSRPKIFGEKGNGVG